eukprot:CAMPEP_0117569046 /NCGR_PEP_ID=MMETSP0784-20121206/58456_1 /TAXON_ID=39447 /ORGANISM="" /LENGTH=450 /DNA_ID=CAMNT_0005367007 /DNA_START=82 /DNA_END=1434 /DNA_ORIENTATION=-
MSPLCRRLATEPLRLLPCAFAGRCVRVANGERKVATQASGVQASDLWRLAGGVCAVGGLSALAFWRWSSPGSLSVGRSPAFRPMTDDVFERADNLLVVLLGDTDLLDRKDELQRLITALAREPSLERVTYWYRVMKGSTPSTHEPAAPASASETGPSSGSTSASDAPGRSRAFRVFVYKGQRKAALQFGVDLSPKELEDVIEFFKPSSEKLGESQRNLEVPFVSGLTFDEDVLHGSSAARPVLLQMYEDTCFMCFLMRPFVNSLARHLRESGLPLRIKRLNLERNDFPRGCPVARGTPTFVLFRGAGNSPLKWEEFRPDELVAKLRRDFPVAGGGVYERVEELQALTAQRMQLFMQVVMWTVELEALQRLCNGFDLPPNRRTELTDPTSDPTFETVVSEMMKKDMRRRDDIEKNVQYLETQVKDVEHDALILGAALAQSVLEKERLQRSS